MVIDFEANCSSNNAKDHEIIEFPAILVEASTGKIVSIFHKFVKPSNLVKLSDFIKDLTGITQEQVDEGLEWGKCLEEFENWCEFHNIVYRNTTVVTCGDWDLKTMLHRQLKISKTQLTMRQWMLFGCWNNIKLVYKSVFSIYKQIGMAEMLNEMNLPLIGRHHSGIDDCRNIVAICCELVKKQKDVTVPNRLRKDPLPNSDNVPYQINMHGHIVLTN